MKANELMIGDWVQHPVYRGNLVPCRVVGISTNITVEFENSARKYEALEFVQPIPITIEILEKNGFKFNDGMFDWFRGDEDSFYTGFETVHIDIRSGFMSVLKESKDGKQKQVRCDCSGYVHELQRALELCGIEKEIKL